jgi:hypothetical protein
MAVRCISSIARLRKYVKFQWGRTGNFLPKGASRLGWQEKVCRVTSRYGTPYHRGESINQTWVVKGLECVKRGKISHSTIL